MSPSIPDRYHSFSIVRGPYEEFIDVGDSSSYGRLKRSKRKTRPLILSATHVASWRSLGAEAARSMHRQSGVAFVLPLVGMEPQRANRIAENFAELAGPSLSPSTP